MNDLIAFLAVARERSFTKAAAKLGVTQSALSHTVRGLEERLGLRLLTRTTRSVAPTEAGQRLLTDIGPKFEEIDAAIEALSELRDKPAGTVRINTSQHAADTVLWPKLARMLPDFPDIKVEIDVDNSLADIVAGGFDAGVRLGERVEKDMIAVRIGPDLRMACIGSPAYLKAHPAPQKPQNLVDHACINLRLRSFGGLYAWEFEKDGRALNVHVAGQLTFNTTPQVLQAALAGFGLGMVMEDAAAPYVTEGRLERVLADWCSPFSGYHLYYPSRRQASPAFARVVDALRYRREPTS